MRVLVINTNRERSPQTLVPLGACLVASSARDAGHDVRFVDLTFSRNPVKQVYASVVDFQPDVVGLSIRNVDNCDSLKPRSYVSEAREIVVACREAGARTVVIGGAAVSAVPGPMLKALGADYAVVGEGERAFPALLGALEQGSGPLEVPGVTALREEELTGLLPAASVDLCRLPDPSLDSWLDIRSYVKSGVSMPVQSKRGCSFNCSYCVYPRIEGSCARVRDPKLVASDVLRVKQLGFQLVEFVDSVFNVPEEHAVACCESVADSKAGIPLQTFDMNPSACSQELIDAMNAAGFSAVGCTVESASDEMLASLGKGFTSADLYRAAEAFRKLSATRLWIFLLGGPGESEVTILETVRFIEKALSPRDLVYVTCGIRVLPGTRAHEQAVDEGMISVGDDLLKPAFYFSPYLTPERAMSLIYGARFPSANIVSASDGNHRLLPIVQRAAQMLGIRPPYLRWTPLLNKVRRLLPGI